MTRTGNAGYRPVFEQRPRCVEEADREYKHCELSWLISNVVFFAFEAEEKNLQELHSKKLKEAPLYIPRDR
jgi:hypothetical protein